MDNVEIVGGPLDEAFLSAPITIARGRNATDMQWVNTPGTRGDLIEFLSTYQTGQKDGACIVQGELVGPQRIAKNVSKNYIVMLDIDTGMTLEELVERVREKSLFAVIWATHSHMKGMSDIAESSYLTWAKKTGFSGSMEEGAYAYLRNEKRYRPNVLSTLDYHGKELMDGGMKLIVHHAAMPKYRVLFFLSEPFDFTAGASQVGQIDAWKAMYRSLSEWLDIPFDRTCIDPSRLMYTPRAKAGSVFGPGLFETLIINGDLLDVNAIAPNLGEDTPASQFTKRVESVVGVDKSRDRQTNFPSELIKFAKDCPDFDVIAFMERFGGDRQDSHGQMDKASYPCPNEDAHTSTANKQGFFVAVDAATGGWYMGCSHDTCRGASGEDRLWFLAEACAKFGVDYKELYEFSEKGRASITAAAESVATVEILAQDAAELDAAIDAIATRDSVAVDNVLKALAKQDKNKDVKDALRKLAKNSGYHFADLKEDLARMKKNGAIQATLDEYGDGASLDPTGVPMAPADLGDAVTIWEEWGSKTSTKACIARLLKLNLKDPFVFSRADGEAVQLANADSPTEAGGAVMRRLDTQKWTAILDEKLHFKNIKTGKPADVFIDGRLASNIAGATSLGLPKLKSISKVPVFSPTGRLITQRGYNPELMMYLDPIASYLSVPDIVTYVDVDEALEYLHELIRDVPFSDVFDGVETVSQMTDEVGSDGWRKPNWSRGRSSRLHFFAMIIQTFARNLIGGNCPAYHIDKHNHGEGGTMLMNLLSIIVENRMASTVALPVREEEVNKTITAALMKGGPLMLFDNIPSGRVNSPEIAQAITAGSWEARKLGVSEIVTEPIRGVWGFVGVNLSFHPELVRRIVPIKINSATLNPAKRDGKLFKHNPGETYAEEMRLELVRACHVLIKYWIQEGRPEDPDVQMHSFTQWAKVMGGIFWVCGLEGFLQNMNNYGLAVGMEDDGGRAGLMRLHAKWKDGTGFTAQEALASFTASLEGMPEGVPTSQSEAGQLVVFGKWLTRDCVGKVVMSADKTLVTLVKYLAGGQSKYRFDRVPVNK